MERIKLVDLVTKAQKGDNNAMNDLFGEFYNTLYFHALKILQREKSGDCCNI